MLKHAPARTQPFGAAALLLFLLLTLAAVAQAALTIPDIPLMLRTPAKPMVMLVAGKDHRLFYEAYNDASDIDGDGTLDIRFKPSITYLGLFNPGLCYTHNGKSANDGLFSPSVAARGEARTCSAAWSGNWLNYVTTSRIDAIRVVLYGGMREVDTTNSTVLRRAYIPQDAHSWAKEYTSEAVDGYRLTDYTPVPMPVAGKRHFFGSLTHNWNWPCVRVSMCSDLPPWLSVIQNSDKRVWDWASSERPVLGDTTHGGALRNDYAVRVEACKGSFLDGCKAYGSGKSTVYKPVGLLQDYGESDQLLFGLITGSYDNSMAGGRLRKVVSSFSNEVNPQTGQFQAVDGIVSSFNALRILDFNGDTVLQLYKGKWVSTRPPLPGEFPDWGNPIGEMMVEALRYFSGKKAPSTAYMGDTQRDTAAGLVQADWDDPYASTSQAKAASCSRSHLLVISDANVSYDSDQVPGAYSAFANAGYVADLTGFSATAEAATITAGEPDVTGSRFIGQSGSSFDSAPSPKKVTSLGEIRGLAPEEPTKEGSYTAAAAAYWGRRTDLRPELFGRQSVDTFVVAMASNLPRIRIPVGSSGSATLVPFAKTVSGSGVNPGKGNFQPTNQIVDFYVDRIANSGPGDRDASVNEGRYFATFRINYEDVEQGGDHEMDAIALYTISVMADGSIKVQVKPLYQSGGFLQRIGYVISGTTADGIYLEVQDESDETPYFLNTPRNRAPGYCDATALPADCKRLPYVGGPPGLDQAERTFTLGTSPAAGWLQGPLWYAAKWGGFLDRDGDLQPKLASEWDADGDGMPDTYLPVQDPIRLRQALQRTLESIAARAASASSIATNSTSVNAGSRLFQAQFNPQRWSGELVAWKVTPEGIPTTPAWLAGEAMPDWQQRRVFMVGSAGQAQRLSSWSALSTVDQGLLRNQATVDYLLGQRSNELRRGGSMRDRSGVLGDIVNAPPYFDRAGQAVFASANDGFLHAFSAVDGQELFAFAPRNSAAQLAALASTAYTHRFLLDGEVQVSARNAATGSHAYLYGLLGRGGKGLFSLDVSDAAQFGASQFLWEYTPAASTAANADRDLGLMLSRPVIAPLANGKLGVLVGNGYNSTDGKSALYIFIVNTNGTLDQVRKITAGDGPNNGMAGPAVFDTDADGRIDTAYAGDLLGQVWKFDLSASDPSKWGLALAGKPLFTARDPSGTAQPITAPLTAARNNRSRDPNAGKIFVFFGTGAYFRQEDPASTQVQSWYGLIDDGASAISDRSALRSRSIAVTGTVGTSPVRAFASATADDMRGRRGWMVDLDKPSAGERIVSASRLTDLAVTALVASSMVPVTDDPCLGGGRGYVNLIDPFSGAAIELGLIDADGNGDPANDRVQSRFIGSIDLRVGLPTESIAITQPDGRTLLVTGGSGDSSSDSLLKTTQAQGSTAYRRRIAWREILTD